MEDNYEIVVEDENEIVENNDDGLGRLACIAIGAGLAAAGYGAVRLGRWAYRRFVKKSYVILEKENSKIEAKEASEKEASKKKA